MKASFNDLMMIIKKARDSKFNFGLCANNIPGSEDVKLYMLRLWNREDESDKLFHDELIIVNSSKFSKETLNELIKLNDCLITREFYTDLNNIHKEYEAFRKEHKIKPKEVYYSFNVENGVVEVCMEHGDNIMRSSTSPIFRIMPVSIMDRIITQTIVTKFSKSSVYEYINNYTIGSDRCKFVNDHLKHILLNLYKVGTLLKSIIIFYTNVEDVYTVEVTTEDDVFFTIKTFRLVI